jgi:hypothetical protein
MRFSPIIVALFLIGCRIKAESPQRTQLRDSLMAQYLKLGDSVYWTDTLNPERKLLVAYNRNDTNFLKEAVETAKAAVKEFSIYRQNPKCPRPPRVYTYGFSEAYQFSYGAAFCDQGLNITVGERNDSILLIAYHSKYIYNTDSCISQVKTTKILSDKQWDLIKRGIFRSDFWGLSPHNFRVGVDGSDLTVSGYEAPKNSFGGRYTVVPRWGAERMALGEVFKLVWDYSAIKVPCFHY